MQEKTQQPIVFPDLDDLKPLFSDQEEIQPEPARRLILSPSGTSVSFLSNTALTGILSNFPLFSSRAGSLEGLGPTDEIEPQERADMKVQAAGQSPATLPTSDKTLRERGRPRGKYRGRKSTISSSRAIARGNRQYTRSRGRVRTRAQHRTLERAIPYQTLREVCHYISRKLSKHLFHRLRLISYDVIVHHDIVQLRQPS